MYSNELFIFRLCKELNHVPLKCDEVLKEDEARLKLEEKMTEALVRICYKCKKPFFKEEGCNKMTCVCGASMCYLCSTPLANGDYKHFNGQGSTNLNLLVNKVFFLLSLKLL